MGRTKRKKGDWDEEYRRALGAEGALPQSGALGSGHSPEPATRQPSKPRRGRQPSKQSSDLPYRGKKRLRGRGAPVLAPPVKLTVEQQRSVMCPRCRAHRGQPCRNQHGKVISSGHAERRWEARRVLRNKLLRGLPKDTPLTAEEHAELVRRKSQVQDPARLPRPRKPRTDDGREPLEAD